MKVSEIKIGETYNGVKVLEKFREKRHTKYWCICPVCGERFSMKAETVGKDFMEDAKALARQYGLSITKIEIE